MMNPSFYIEKTDEVVLIKPNGVMEFWKGNQATGRMVNSLTFESESAALHYAREKEGWKEGPVPV